MRQNDIVEAYFPCMKLLNTSSRLEKESILRENTDNKPFKEVLQYLLDNMRISGISEKRFCKEVDILLPNHTDDLSIITLLHYFDTHNSGSDANISYVKGYTQELAYCQDSYKYPEELYNFVKDVVTKSLRIGVDYTTANKVYGSDFIQKKEVMLGTSIEHCDVPDGTWFSVSQKLNGTRCFYCNGSFYSRQGKVFTGLEHIAAALQTVCNDMNTEVDDWVFDGELILKDLSAGDSASFQISTGIANSKDSSKKELKLVLFDVIPKECFENRADSEKYSERKKRLEAIREVVNKLYVQDVDVVKVFYSGTDFNKVWEYLDYAEKNDMEGVMLNLDTPYRFGRTKELIKVKKFYTMDLKVTRIEKGTGRNKNRMGKAIVDYKGNEVGVGSGFSDEQRNYFWDHPHEIVGHIIEVKYKEQTKNKEGAESLQFPVFVSIRNDKDEVSFE